MFFVEIFEGRKYKENLKQGGGFVIKSGNKKHFILIYALVLLNLEWKAEIGSEWLETWEIDSESVYLD